MSKNLTASLEDYLELIYNLAQKNKNLKAIEISQKLNISRASVSEALNKLSDKNLIIYDSHKCITITEDGKKKAKEVIKRHNTLTDFFANCLNLGRIESEENACKIEHVISDKLFKRMCDFKNYCNKNPEFIAKFKERYIKHKADE